MPKRERKYFDDATIVLRNFAGKPSQYNAAGNRNFCVVIDDPDEAQRLKEEGWNVKTFRQSDPDREPDHYIQVAVNFGGYRPCKIVLIEGRKRTALDEDNVGLLDRADIERVDFSVNPSYWEKNDGSTGIKAYLDSMYVTLEEDELAKRYAEYEDCGDEDIPF